MKIRCLKSDLVKGVSIVSKAVPTKTTMPILECILIDATTDIIKLTANDMELGIETVIRGQIDEKGMIALDARIFSDIVRRNQIRKVDQLEWVVKYTFSNVGNTFSAKSISDYLKSEKRSIDNETVYSYLEKLEKAYILHRCSRYDLQGKEILKTQEKFYLADTSLRYSVLGYEPDSVASSLENVVYLELCRRGYKVYIGKTLRSYYRKQRGL